MEVLPAWEERAYGGRGDMELSLRGGEGLGSRSCVRIPKMVCPKDGRFLGHSPLWGRGRVDSDQRAVGAVADSVHSKDRLGVRSLPHLDPAYSKQSGLLSDLPQQQPVLVSAKSGSQMSTPPVTLEAITCCSGQSHCQRESDD